MDVRQRLRLFMGVEVCGLTWVKPSRGRHAGSGGIAYTQRLERRGR
jgi:hypothetical protein